MDCRTTRSANRPDNSPCRCFKTRSQFWPDWGWRARCSRPNPICAPPRSAKFGALRPRVAVSAEGNAVGVWGEDGGDGRTHVFSRRLTGTTLSSFPQDLTLPDFEGGAGGSADSPDIDIEDDGSFAWVAFRQDIGGRSRSIARRLLGST